MYRRRPLLVVLAGGAVLFALLVLVQGYDATWRLWNIPTLNPHFADARSITAGAESHRAGLDPLLANPADPWQRPLNYPRVWQTLFGLGLDQGDTTLVGLIMIVAFLAGLVFFVDDYDRLTAAIMGVALFSPAVLLGIERANNDLFVFFLLAGALRALRRSAVLAGVVITAAAVLMLFPAFGLACLLRARRRICLLVVGACSLVLILYGWLIQDDLLLMKSATTRGTFFSYGREVAGTLVRNEGGPAVAIHVVNWVVGLALALVVVVAVMNLRSRRFDPAPPAGQRFDAFRLGAAVYVGTFLVSNNWDYRLMFLLFCLPQLVSWSRAGAPTTRLTLIAVLASLWLPFAFSLGGAIPRSGYLLFALDELANWLAFAGLALLLVRTLPPWLGWSAAGDTDPTSTTAPAR